MQPTRVVLALLVPFVVLGNAGFGYAGRSLWYAQAAEPSQYGTLALVSAAGALAGCVIVAGLGALAGPGAAAAVGLFVAAGGQLLVGADALWAGAFVAGVGRALVGVGTAAVLARAVANGNHSGRMALYCLAYAAVNLGASTTNLLGSWGRGEAAAGLVVCAVGLAVTGIIALPVAALPLVRSEDLDPPRTDPAVLGVAVATALLGASAMTVSAVGNDAQTASLVNVVDGDVLWIYAVNPSVALLASALGAMVLGGLALGGVRAPPLAVLGVGLAFTGAALVPTPFGWGILGTAVLFATSALGEPLVYAGLWAQVSGGVHPRLTPVLGAIVYAGSTLPAFLHHLGEAVGVDDVATDPWVAAAAGVALLLAAVVALVVGVLRRHDGVQPDEAAPAAAAAPGGMDPYGFDAR